MRQPVREGGFTILELLVTMLLLSIMLGLAVAPYRNYQRKQSHLSSTRKIVGVLRNAQVRAVAEDSTYRVLFAPTSYRVERFINGVWTLQITHRHDDLSVSVPGASFADSSGSQSAYCYFYPRGAASKGQLTVVRSNSSKVYTVSVEGLTARVSYS